MTAWGLNEEAHQAQNRLRGAEVKAAFKTFALLWTLTLAVLPCLAQQVSVYPIEVDGTPAVAIGNGELIVPGSYGGEKVLGFSARENPKDKTYSYLLVTPTRIIWKGNNSFEVLKENAKIEAKWLANWGGGQASFGIEVKTSTNKYKLYPCAVAVSGARSSEMPYSTFKALKYESARDAEWTKWANLAVSDFSAALRNAHDVTQPLERHSLSEAAHPEPATPSPAKPALPSVGTIMVSTEPPGGQVYLDDQFKGITGELEGKLVVGNIPAGTYRLRVSQAGHKDWAQSITVSPGEELNIQAKLVSAGPAPLTLKEMEDALANGVPKSRLTTLVDQYGVNFALTNEAEQRLRNAGADSDLLLAIAKNRK